MASSDEGEIRDYLSALGPDSLRSLRRILMSPTDDRQAILRELMSVPESSGRDVLAELIAVCDQDEVARLTVLRGIRDATH